MKKTKEKNTKTPRESLLCITEERFARKYKRAIKRVALIRSETIKKNGDENTFTKVWILARPFPLQKTRRKRSES
jgi:hypothetical protein